MNDELRDELETKHGLTIGRQMAYGGKDDCVSPRCRRLMAPDGKIRPGCVGWHCPTCHEPTNMYGHDCPVPA